MTVTGYTQKLVVLVLTVGMIAACGDDPKSDSSQTTAGLRKKIAAPETGEPGKAPKQQTPEGASSRESSKDKRETGATAQPTEPALPDKSKVIEPRKSEGLKLAEGLGERKISLYDPTGKIDPFESPLETQTEQVPAQVEKAKEKRIPVTPLQRISLGQLELVAIVLAPSGNKALVEDPSGKGYIVSRGTYVGQNYGRIKSILKDRIIVEEEVEDFVSRSMKTRTRELKLHKKVGDV